MSMYTVLADYPITMRKEWQNVMDIRRGTINPVPISPPQQNTLLGNKYQFDVCKGSFVQIIHDGQLHWITILTIHSSEGEIDVYNSLYMKVNLEVHMQIANILMSTGKRITIHMKGVQKQSEGGETIVGFLPLLMRSP